MSKSLAIAKNSVYLYFRMLVVLGTSLYTVRIVLKALGVEDFGIYGVAGSIVAIFAFLNNTMSIAAQRFLGIDIGKNDNVALGKTFNATLVAHTIIALILIVLGETFGLWLLNNKLNIPEHRLPAANIVMHLSIAATIGLVLRMPFNALIVARQKMWFFSITSIAEALLKLAIAFSIAHASIDRLIFYAALVCTVSWLMLIWYISFCRLKFPESQLSMHRDWPIYKGLAAFISWSFIGSLSNVFRTQGVNMLLNVFWGPMLNAAYGVMTQAQTAAAQFANSFQMALSPQIYQSHAQGNRQRMNALLFTGTKLNFILLAFLVLPALYGMDYLLKLWLGQPPPYASTFIKWMLVNQLLESMSQPLITAAAATGNIRNYQLVVAGVMSTSVPLSGLGFYISHDPYIFLYIFFATQLLAFALRIWFLKDMIDLQVGDFLLSVASPLFVLSIISAALLYMVTFFWGTPNSIGSLAVGAITIILSMIPLFFFIGTNHAERAFFGEWISKRKCR